MSPRWDRQPPSPWRSDLDRETLFAAGVRGLVDDATPDGADATKRLGAVLLLMADEVDRLAGVVDRLSRQSGWRPRWTTRSVVPHRCLTVEPDRRPGNEQSGGSHTIGCPEPLCESDSQEEDCCKRHEYARNEHEVLFTDRERNWTPRHSHFLLGRCRPRDRQAGATVGSRGSGEPVAIGHVGGVLSRPGRRMPGVGLRGRRRRRRRHGPGPASGPAGAVFEMSPPSTTRVLSAPWPTDDGQAR